MQSVPNVPRALIHQSGVVEAIASLFSLPPPAFQALERGGSRVFEKAVRAYHYWAAEHPPHGICPYDRPLLGYFRLTPQALASGTARQLHREHAVPVRRLVHELRRIRQAEGAVSRHAAERVMAANEIVVMTKAEAARLDGRYRSEMPGEWALGQSHLRRLELMLGIGDDDLLGVRQIGPAPGR
ncbi:MAG TPA: hypothetical protein VFE82_07530 [Ramlibacter sp.]|uniref:hypothetical protein n=1 Tax=Ramlibacter sp. TaxID=1917967 RepID=UPI002D290CF9|nr:hypothetical protein [Ramlibacter sp.]HZY18316.1 hypothetical protein [Ramlibacter sp.]